MVVAFVLVSVYSKRGWIKKPRVESSAAATAAHDGDLNTGLGAFQARLDKKAKDSSRAQPQQHHIMVAYVLAQMHSRRRSPLSTTGKPQILYGEHPEHTSSQF